MLHAARVGAVVSDGRLGHTRRRLRDAPGDEKQSDEILDRINFSVVN